MNDPVRLRRDVPWTILAQTASVVLGIFNAALIARWLGPEGKGALALALLLPELLAMALSGGVDAANVFFSASTRFRVAELTSASLGLALAATVTAFAIVGALTLTGVLPLLLPGPGRSWLALAMLVLPPVILTGYFAGILRGRGSLPAVNAIRVLQAAAQLALTGAFVIAWPGGVQGAVLATVGGALVGACLAGLELRRHGAAFRPSLGARVVRPLLAYGLRGHLGNLCQFLNYRLDSLLVNYFVGAAGLGLYTAAVRMAETLLQVPSAMAFVVFPAAAAGNERARETTRRALTASLGVAGVGGAVLALAGPSMLRLVYSSAFADSYGAMLALLPGMFFMGAVKVLAADLAGRAYPHYNSAISAIGLPVTLILGLALIPRYGLIGAGTATSLSYACSLAATVVVFSVVRKRAGGQAAPSIPLH